MNRHKGTGKSVDPVVCGTTAGDYDKVVGNKLDDYWIGKCTRTVETSMTLGNAPVIAIHDMVYSVD